MSRRRFLAATSAAAGAATAAAEGSEAPPASPRPQTGEPYELAGKRLVFTTWTHVRPGGFGWFNAKGENVTVRGSESPTEATFRRVDQPRGIRIVAQPAERAGPVIVPETPWEQGGKGLSINTIVRVGDRFRAWGGCPSGACLWESTDGVRWERPELGLTEHAGSRANNLLNISPGTVFVDPSAPPEERYKAVDLSPISEADFEAFKRERPDAWEPRAHRRDVGHVYSIRGCVSPDGARWTPLPQPLAVEHSDTQLVAYYDERLRRYVLYTRNYMIGERSSRAPGENIVWWGGDAGGIGRRSIGRSESTDFRRFPVSEVIVEPGPDFLPNDVLYTNCRTTIPGAPDHHLMFPAVWHCSDDTTSIALAASRDGKLWHFVPGSPVFATGTFGGWDGGAIFAQPNLVELPDGRFVLPFTGYNVPHKYPRGQMRTAPGLAVWPKGRIVALQVDDLGEFATAQILPPGRKLRLNAVTQRGGSVLVEVAGPDGKPLPKHAFADARPLIGDCYRQPVTWAGADDLGHAGGAPVMLRFRLDRAKLFAVEFG